MGGPNSLQPMNCSIPGSSFHGIFQARILEWFAISFSKGSSHPRDWTRVSCLAGRFFTNWATKEALVNQLYSDKNKWMNEQINELIIPISVEKMWYIHPMNIQFSSVQSLSRVWLFATPWITARQASLSIINSWSSLKLMSIESGMPSSHLILYHSLLLLPPVPLSIRVFSNESTLHMKWPKYWGFSFSISPSNEHPGLISFRMDWLDLLAVQGTLNYTKKNFWYMHYARWKKLITKGK